MKQTTIIAIVLGVLLIMSAVQAIQLTVLKTKIVKEGFNMKSASSTVKPASSGGASVPSNLQNLPSMVGGC